MLFSKISLVLAKFVVATMAPSGREMFLVQRIFVSQECCLELQVQNQ